MSHGEHTFRVFVSSTFQDMVAERNVLQQKTFSRLRDYCRKRGASCQAIDLRWGVSEQASLGQQTMSICLGEIRRCQEIAAGALSMWWEVTMHGGGFKASGAVVGGASQLCSHHAKTCLSGCPG